MNSALTSALAFDPSEADFHSVRIRARAFVFERGSQYIHLSADALQSLPWWSTASQEFRDHTQHWVARFKDLDALQGGASEGAAP